MIEVPSPITCDICDGRCCKTLNIFYADASDLTPEDKAVLEFYIIHKGVSIIFSENQNVVAVKIYSPCIYLDGDGRCAIYNERPGICQRHEMKSCERNLIGEFTRVEHLEQLQTLFGRWGINE